MVNSLIKIINEMTVALGERRGDYYHAEFTVKDVLEKADKPNIEKEQNYVIYTIARFFEGSTISTGNGDNGGFINMKVRTK